MTRSARHDHVDAGFTLTELTVGIALLSLVLAVAWSGMFVINKSADVSASAASAARDASMPLEEISECLMQNNMMAATDFNGANPTGPNAANVWTNKTMGPNPEMDSFVTVLGTDGKYRLLWRTWTTASNMQTLVSTKTWILSYNNVNKLVNVPLFTYFDASGTVVASPADIPSKTRSVLVRVVAALPDSGTIEATRTIYFRNRN